MKRKRITVYFFPEEYEEIEARVGAEGMSAYVRKLVLEKLHAPHELRIPPEERVKPKVGRSERT